MRAAFAAQLGAAIGSAGPVGQNFLIWSEDLTNAAWVDINTPTSKTATTLTLDFGDGIQQTFTPASTPSARTFTISALVSVAAGTMDVRLGIYEVFGASSNWATAVSVGTTPTRLSFTHTVSTNASHVSLIAQVQHFGGADGGVLTLTEVQVEEAASAGTYQPTTTVPIGVPT